MVDMGGSSFEVSGQIYRVVRCAPRRARAAAGCATTASLLAADESGDVFLDGGDGGGRRDQDPGACEECRDGAERERAQPGGDLGHSFTSSGAGEGGGGGVGE